MLIKFHKNIFSFSFKFLFTDDIFKFIFQMKFHIYSFNEKTALYIAVDDGKLEIVQLLLARDEIDINAKYILKN